MYTAHFYKTTHHSIENQTWGGREREQHEGISNYHSKIKSHHHCIYYIDTVLYMCIYMESMYIHILCILLLIIMFIIILNISYCCSVCIVSFSAYKKYSKALLSVIIIIIITRFIELLYHARSLLALIQLPSFSRFVNAGLVIVLENNHTLHARIVCHVYLCINLLCVYYVCVYLH